jgi:hypothetical protein
VIWPWPAPWAHVDRRPGCKPLEAVGVDVVGACADVAAERGLDHEVPKELVVVLAGRRPHCTVGVLPFEHNS